MNWLVRLLTFVLFLVIAGTVGLTFVLERATRYPVDANFLTPWIEQNASRQLGNGAVSIGKTRIALQPGQGGARLLLTDVQASGGPVEKPLDVGEIAVAVSLPDMLLGRLRLTKLTIDDFRFAAKRDAQGNFAFSVAARTQQEQTMELASVAGSASNTEQGDITALETALPAQTDANLSAMDQLRAALRDRSGILSRFEELKVTGGHVEFEDLQAGERIVVHEATLTFFTEPERAEMAVDGLFEIGASLSPGGMVLGTDLEPGADFSLAASLSDMALADLAAYLPKDILADQRPEPVDMRINLGFTDEGKATRFAVRRYRVGTLAITDPTFAPEPDLIASGELAPDGPGGWQFNLQAPKLSFATEPTLRQALGDFFTFDGPLAGEVDIDLAKDGRLLSVAFDTQIESGTALIPSLYTEPLQLTSGSFKGLFTPTALRFDELSLAPVINGRALPSTSLDVEILTPARNERRVRLAFANDWQLSTDDVLSLWPDVGNDEGRQWFVNNVVRGQTSAQQLSLDMETRDGKTTVNDLQATIDFSRGTMKVTDGLGFTQNASGRVAIDNGLFNINLSRGTLGPTSYRDTAIRLDLREADDGRLAVEGQFDGPLQDSLRYLVGADVGLQDLGRTIPIDRTSGSLSVTGDMSLSLAQPARFAPDFDFRVDLSDLVVRDYLAGLPVTAASLPVRVTPDRVATSGAVRLGAINTSTTLDLQLDQGNVQNLTVSARYDGQSEDAKRLLGPLPNYIKGRMTGDLTFVQDARGRRNLAVTADLARTTIDLGPLPYFKPVGQPASAEARMILNEAGLQSIESFRIDGPALHVLGNVDMAADGQDFRSIDVRNLIIGDSNLSRVSVQNEAEFLQVSIEDGQLDGRPLIESILDNQGQRDANIVTGEAQNEEENQLTAKPWLVNISGIRRFVVPGGKAFTDIELSATIDEGAVLQFSLAAQSPAHLPGRPSELGNLRASLTPQANGFYRLAFQSDDAGSLFSTLDLTDEIRGGVISVTADSALPLPKGGWLGSMEMRNFSIVDAPIMVQLLSLASLTGILEIASGAGLQFANMSSNFTYGNSALYLDDLRMAGPSLGLTTEGSIDFGGKRFALQGNVTPFNLVSEIAGSIPIFGQVLTGTDGGGLFSAGYRINGSFSNPSVSVNPFQILTPGIYRQWFQDIIGN